VYAALSYACASSVVNSTLLQVSAPRGVLSALLLLYYCCFITTALLLLYCFFITSALLLLYCCFTATLLQVFAPAPVRAACSPLSCYCTATLLLRLYCYFTTNALLLLYYRCLRRRPCVRHAFSFPATVLLLDYCCFTAT
jgi:hypothetical protein